MADCNNCNKPCDLRSEFLDISFAGRTANVKVRKQFKFGAYKEFRILEKDCIMQHIDTIRFDLEEIDDGRKIDSSALGMLLVLRGNMPNVKLEFVNCHDCINQLFNIAHIYESLNLPN